MKFDHRRIQSCRSSILIVTSTSLFKEDFLNHTSLLVSSIIISAFPIRFIPPYYQFRMVDVIIKNMMNYILRNSHIYLFLMTIFFDFCDQYIRLFRANGRIFHGQLLSKVMIQVVLHMIEKPPHQRQRGIEPFGVTSTFQSRACINI